MKKFLDTVRFIFISPEIVFGIVVLLLMIRFSETAKFISSYIFNPKMQWNDYIKLLGIPVTSLVFTYKFGEMILNPEDKENRKKLKTWPNYWMLRNRIYYALVISVLSLLGSLWSWYYAIKLDMTYGTIFLITFWSISLVSFSTVALAKLSIKDILY